MAAHLKAQISTQVQMFGLDPKDWRLRVDKNHAVLVHRLDNDLKLVGKWIWNRKTLVLKTLELASL